ncbi:MAG: methyltransferase domain-containing protein [Pseudomonadota bacterium]
MKTHLFALASFSVLSFAACGGPAEEPSESVTTEEAAAPEAEPEVVETVDDDATLLSGILDAQAEENQARFDDRNPAETLEFFGIAPGMTVAEILPGGGWYTKILLPYLGDEGALIGIDYSIDMWSKFGGFATPEFLEAKETWAETWTEGALEWRGDTEAGVSALVFGSRDPATDGTVDAVLMIRALHHLNRFNTDEKNYMDEALADIHALLKPGGTFAIVQHRGPEENDDEWAKGDNGYMKQSAVIAMVEAAGFELAAESEINANPKDVPTNEEFVWRLPPSLGTSEDDPELKAQMEAIGETDRMTLKFTKT